MILKIKNIYLGLFLVVLISGTVLGSEVEIQTGDWDYKLLMNSVKIGTASFKNRFEKKKYISSSEIKMKVSGVINFSKQVITETKDFRPLKIEIQNKIITDKKIQDNKTTVVVKKNKLEVSSGDLKSTVKPNRPFIFDGHFIMANLLKNNFKKDLEIKKYIYDPSIDLKKPFLVIVKVIGTEKVLINNEELELVHLKQSIENIKTIDFYVNFKGIMQKAVIEMANNKIELLKD